jgi:hypothetical protein
MAIIAENKGGGNYTPVEAGTYSARCYSMVHIGTVETSFEGVSKKQNKVRLTWELPTELKEFKPGEGLKPYVVSKEFTLSMHEKSSLRKILESWRGKSFTEEEAKKFDVTKLIGAECLISIIHKEVAGSNYANISSISRLPKGMNCPSQINENFIFSYDLETKKLNELLASLPDFLQTKIKSSDEWKKIESPNHSEAIETPLNIDDVNDLLF